MSTGGAFTFAGGGENIFAFFGKALNGMIDAGAALNGFDTEAFLIPTAFPTGPFGILFGGGGGIAG